MNSSLMCLYGEAKPSSLVKAKTAAKTRHVCLYGEAKPVQLGIDCETAKAAQDTMEAVLGELACNHEVGGQRKKDLRKRTSISPFRNRRRRDLRKLVAWKRGSEALMVAKAPTVFRKTLENGEAKPGRLLSW